MRAEIVMELILYGEVLQYHAVASETPWGRLPDSKVAYGIIWAGPRTHIAKLPRRDRAALACFWRKWQRMRDSNLAVHASFVCVSREGAERLDGYLRRRWWHLFPGTAA